MVHALHTPGGPNRAIMSPSETRPHDEKPYQAVISDIALACSDTGQLRFSVLLHWGRLWGTKGREKPRP
jgi:hypothetical protein